MCNRPFRVRSWTSKIWNPTRRRDETSDSGRRAGHTASPTPKLSVTSATTCANGMRSRSGASETSKRGTSETSRGIVDSTKLGDLKRQVVVADEGFDSTDDENCMLHGGKEGEVNGDTTIAESVVNDVGMFWDFGSVVEVDVTLMRSAGTAPRLRR